MQLAESLWCEGQRLFWLTHLWATKSHDATDMSPQDYIDKRRTARLLLEAAAALDPMFADNQDPEATAPPLLGLGDPIEE
jgi:hypothetical protein